jgi:hypothetical protein
MTKELAVKEIRELAVAPEFDVQRVVAQTAAIQQCLRAVMRENEHFGVIPGTPKPSLWQPGADKLCMLFRLRCDYEVATSTERDDWIAMTVRCRLYSIQTGNEVGSGMGSANSRETKYVSQSQAKLCPKCGKAAIIKGKKEYAPKGDAYKDGGWLCYRKKDGCGVTFPDDDKGITQQSGQVLKDKVWDLHNTLVKMACKRAKVAAVLTATAASDIFTQDLEDLQDVQANYTPPPAAEGKKEDPRPKAPSPQEPSSARAAESSSPGPEMPVTTAPVVDEDEESADHDDPPEAGDMVEVFEFVSEKIDPNIKSKTNTVGEWVSKGPYERRTEAQNKKIHALKRELGITDDQWRSRLVKLFSKESSGDLAKHEANILIDKLEQRKRLHGTKADKDTRQQAKADGMGREFAEEFPELKGA